MLISIRHETCYRFAGTLEHGLQRLLLTPKETQGQRIHSWAMAYEGVKRELEFEDHNCNHATLVSLVPGAGEVAIRCEGVVETVDNSGILGTHSGHLPLWSFLAQTPRTQPGSGMRALAAAARRDDGDQLAQLHDLSAAIREAVQYRTGTTDVGTTAEEAVTEGHGVCQDHAHAFIGLARLLEFPARYVSGYLLIDGQVEQEATHAWAEAHVEGLGWVGFDVSNGICPDPRYVRVATGRDYAEAAPVTGISYGTAKDQLSVSLAVEQRQTQQ